MQKSKKTIFWVGTFLLTLWTSLIIWNYLKPYTIADWQVDYNSTNWQLSPKIIAEIEHMNDTTINNIPRYEQTLAQVAITKGISKQEINSVLKIADQQAYNNMVPVYIKTARKQGKEIIIIVYKYGDGWSGRLLKFRPLLPISMPLQEQWAVVIQRDNSKVIYSSGTM